MRTNRLFGACCKAVRCDRCWQDWVSFQLKEKERRKIKTHKKLGGDQATLGITGFFCLDTSKKWK